MQPKQHIKIIIDYINNFKIKEIFDYNKDILNIAI